MLYNRCPDLPDSCPEFPDIEVDFDFTKCGEFQRYHPLQNRNLISKNVFFQQYMCYKSFYHLPFTCGRNDDGGSEFCPELPGHTLTES
jgi:hypothetical protein